MIVNTWQVGMGKISKQKRFTFKGSSSLDQFLWAQTVLTHFLDGHQALAEEGIFCLVDSPEATGLPSKPYSFSPTRR